MNTHRRIFRGRGGPNDRRLPKYNARRRRVHREAEESNPELDPEAIQIGDLVEEAGDHVSPCSDLPGREDAPTSEDDVEETNEAEVLDFTIETESPFDGRALVISGAEASVEGLVTGSKVDDPIQQELSHLKRRIRNNRESFSLAKAAISNPEVYQNNVLNSVKNCIDEWKGILGHYPDLTTENGGCQMGQEIFELLQQALQCGPLAGSKPGYFKRCGSSVATFVHAFLYDVIASPEEAKKLQFTEKQVAVVETWKTAALKASEKNAPPSKSVIQRQQEADKIRQAKVNKKMKKING